MNILTFNTNVEAVNVASRALFIAYNASLVFGMGAFKAQENKTENEVFNNVITKGDYPGKLQSIPDMSNCHLYADYVYGRMMKLKMTIVNNTIQFYDDKPKIGFQSWATTYKSYNKLFKLAMKELNIKPLENKNTP
jgi:hypothetical protein